MQCDWVPVKAWTYTAPCTTFFKIYRVMLQAAGPVSSDSPTQQIHFSIKEK